MSLSVGGTTNQRKLIEKWLQRICWRAQVNLANGRVTLKGGDPPAGGCSPGDGCDCLKKMIDDKNRSVTIHPTKEPKKTKIKVPKSPLGPASEETLAKSGGGITVGEGDSGFGTEANPGKDAQGKVGANAEVYIDMTNNDGDGYEHGMEAWLILGHELTSGHAFHLIGGTCASTKAEAEAQAIRSENELRRAQHPPLDPRPIPE